MNNMNLGYTPQNLTEVDAMKIKDGKNKFTFKRTFSKRYWDWMERRIVNRALKMADLYAKGKIKSAGSAKDLVSDFLKNTFKKK